jgi:very-short-patch-repair endonuclease
LFPRYSPPSPLYFVKRGDHVIKFCYFVRWEISVCKFVDKEIEKCIFLLKHYSMSRSGHPDFKAIKKRARELRNNTTSSEALLWKELRNRNLCGYKFLRQHPIVYNPYGSGVKYFVADFYCDIKKTVIELDGPIHDSNIEYDQFRNS